VPYQAIEVDQSGKIETAQDTILAYSDGRRYAICIPSRVKRAMLAYLRRQGRSKPRAVIWLFAAGLFVLLHDVLQVSRVTIDLEYAGHEADIRSMVLRFARQQGLQVEAEAITFAAVGKQSGAHEQAIGVFRGHYKANRTITLSELMAMSRGERKRPGSLTLHCSLAPWRCFQGFIRATRS